MWGSDCCCAVNACLPSGQLGHGDNKDSWAPVQVMRFRTNNSKYYDLRMPFL